MWFVVAKTLLYLLVPPAGLFLLMIAGFVIIRLCPQFGRFLVAAGFLALYALSISPVSGPLLRPLESAVPPLKDTRVVADAVVVLGGGVRDLGWAGLPAAPSSASLERLVSGIALQRRLNIPLVLVGGNGDPSRSVTAEAEAMARIAREAGVAARRIIVESRSRNTIEGAQALGRLIAGRRIVLVTSATHMKRAAALFRKSGFAVIPAPTAYIGEQRPVTFSSFIPHASNLGESAVACTEYASLFWYTVNGSM